ncbi:hypothetical protein OSC52_13525 [Clostridium pasteurianum]|uniref:hypothetical protein n=1 Tax=Clostridium pasteurianum TaxID=1501 RepID=UPI002260C28E|nr:hypothetical protein [Clostridium pasteurianum]UZW12869.1 hypothetical protein OSC52_13525 [Clostridium pasteurianum]
MNKKIEQIQNDLTFKLKGLDIYKIDTYTYDCLIITIIDTISKFTNIGLSINNVINIIGKNYILFQVKDVICSRNSRFTILIEFEGRSVSNIEVSILY